MSKKRKPGRPPTRIACVTCGDIQIDQECSKCRTHRENRERHDRMIKAREDAKKQQAERKRILEERRAKRQEAKPSE